MTFAELTALEAWRKRVAAAGFRAIAEPWSPPPRETPLPPPAKPPRGARK